MRLPRRPRGHSVVEATLEGPRCVRSRGGSTTWQEQPRDGNTDEDGTGDEGHRRDARGALPFVFDPPCLRKVTGGAPWVSRAELRQIGAMVRREEPGDAAGDDRGGASSPDD